MTCRDIVWLVVDDGSEDGTSQLVNRFRAEADFEVRYLYRTNGGKHAAINDAMKVVDTPWVMVVDSDDEVLPQAIESLKPVLKHIEMNGSIAGITARCIDADGNIIGTPLPDSPLITDYVTLRGRLKIYGDMISIYRTDIISRYPFPVFEDEKFCPEALIRQRIAEKYNMYHVELPVIRAIYRSGGLSDRWVANMLSSPRAVSLYYAEASHHRCEPWKRRQIHRILFWTYTMFGAVSLISRLRMVGAEGWLHIFPAAILRLYYKLRPGAPPLL